VISGEHFAAVVIGSGFGGSVMAYRLADAGLKVCVLERGKPYPPGSFARTPADMSTNFWNPSEGGQGLFSVWSFPGIESVVSAGLGGGSLIYANVLIRKDEKWFVKEDPAAGGFEYWPVTRQDLDPHYDRVEAKLLPQTYPVNQSPYDSTPKTIAFRAAAAKAGLQWFLPNLAVTFANPGRPAVPGEPIVDGNGRPLANLHGRTRYTCRLVGECDVGCNYGSKNSLDYNYLTDAKNQGAEIRTRSEVRSFAPKDGGGYWVRYVEHHPENENVKTETSTLPEVELTTDRLIVSAGVFGSTFLLLKNRGSFPHLSPTLGTHFSGNGDLLGFAHRSRGDRNLDPMQGPVITSTVRVPDELDGGVGRGFYVQEGGFPQFVGWMLEAANTPHQFLRVAQFLVNQAEAAIEDSPQSVLNGELEALLKAPDSARVMLMLGMGRDVPNGIMSLRDRWLQLDWTLTASRTYYDRVQATMAAIAAELGADFTINPLWYLRKVITVHGLGGCPMGRDENEGVVDSNGAVFNYPGLYVADGSVMPGPVGPNPSLTIAALADRFADGIVDSAAQISRP